MKMEDYYIIEGIEPTSKISGILNHTNLIKSVLKNDYNVFILRFSEIDEDKFESQEIYFAKRWKNNTIEMYFHSWIKTILYLKSLKISKTSIIHINNFCDLGFIPLFFPNNPILYFFHGRTQKNALSRNSSMKKRIQDVVFFTLIKLFNSRANGIVVNGTFLKNQLMNYYSIKESEIYILPLGIQPIESLKSNNSIDIRSKYNIAPNDIVLLSSCRFSSERRIDIFIEIFLELIKEYNNIFLILIGDGPEKGLIEEKIKKSDYENRIILPGILPQDVLFEHIESADIGLYAYIDDIQVPIQSMEDIFTYDYELIGYSGLEIMLFGKPLVCLFNMKNKDKQIQDNQIHGGYCVHYENTLAFSSIIEGLIKDRNLRIRIGSEGQQLVFNKHSIINFQKNINDILIKIS